MQVLWKLKKAFVKDLLDELPDPKPHYNTVSTIVRGLVEKGFLGYKAYGNTHQYYPLLGKEEYTRAFMGDILENYFDNSFQRMVAFFAKEEELSPDEVQEIINLIEKKKD